MPQGMRRTAYVSVSTRTPCTAAATYSTCRMEFLAYVWDDLDDAVGACRHVATSAVTETLATAVPFIAAASGMLLACTTALLLAREHLARLLA